MLGIKDNLSYQGNHIIMTVLTVNDCYKFESEVLRRFFTNIKLACSPLIMGGIHTNESTILARLLCILSNKRIYRVIKELKGLKVCWHVY